MKGLVEPICQSLFDSFSTSKKRPVLWYFILSNAKQFYSTISITLPSNDVTSNYITKIADKTRLAAHREFPLDWLQTLNHTCSKLLAHQCQLLNTVKPIYRVYKKVPLIEIKLLLEFECKMNAINFSVTKV